MGAAKGTLTYTTYFVMDEPDAGFRDRFMDSIAKHAFRDVDIAAGKDRSVGWVVIGEPFDTQPSWGKVFQDPYVCVSLREDTIKVPKTVFQLHYDLRERKFLESQGRDAMKKSEKAAIKEDVMADLRRRALPDIKVHDVVWNTVDGSIRLWTHSKRVKESFEEIVADTWGIRIIPQAPYTLLLARTDRPDDAALVLDVEPADLVNTED